MHDGDLGVLLNLHGSSMDEIVCEAPGSMEHARAVLFKDIGETYSELGIGPEYRTRSLKLDHYHKPGDWSCLSCKAAVSRHLVPVMQRILEKRGIVNDRDKHRYRCYELLQQSLEIIEQNQMFLPDDAAQCLGDIADYFLLHYNWLTKHYHGTTTLRYNYTMKNHYLWHCLCWGRYLNPKCSWNYSFEAMMGLVTRASTACTAGTPLIQTGAKTLLNVRLATFIRYKRNRDLCGA
jgi:hypothetical protein